MERGKSYSVALMILIRVIVVLVAVGTYYLWHGAFELPAPVSVVGALATWIAPQAVMR